MAYVLVVEQEQFQLAALKGWNEFAQWVDVVSNIPTLTEFVDKGMSQNLQGLVSDLNWLIDVATNNDVKDIAQTMRDNIQSIEGATVAYMYDGLTDEDVEDEWYYSPEEDMLEQEE